MHTTLFFYGTLCDPDILAAVLPGTDAGALPGAVAPDHAAVYYPGEVFPALVPKPGARAQGLVFVTDDPLALAALDAFEGERYFRAGIMIETGTGPVEALYYRPAEPIAPDAPAWSLALWQREHKPQVLEGERALARSARKVAF